MTRLVSENLRVTFSGKLKTGGLNTGLSILPGITKLDPKYIAKSWETYTQTQIWPRIGEVNLKGVQTVLNMIAEEGMIKKPLPKPEEIVDSSFLDEARKALPR